MRFHPETTRAPLPHIVPYLQNLQFAKLLQEFAKTEDEEKDVELTFIDYKVSLRNTANILNKISHR